MDYSKIIPMPEPIEFITIHCSATPKSRKNTAEEVTQWDMRRFGQPSYHFVIGIDGEVTQTLPLDKLGAHVGGHNSHNIGVCYVGGMSDDMTNPLDTRTAEQKLAMSSLLHKMKTQFPKAQILGHRDWPGVKKACPSFDVKSWLKEVGL